MMYKNYYEFLSIMEFLSVDDFEGFILGEN